MAADRTVPGAFNAVLLAGAAYVAWIGVSLFRGASSARAMVPASPVAPGATFRRGAITNLLNPKAYLFMLAIFPQFVRPELGPFGSRPSPSA